MAVYRTFSDPRQIRTSSANRPNSCFRRRPFFWGVFQTLFPVFSEEYGLRPARTGHHVRTFDAVFQRVCAHQRQTTHRPTATQRRQRRRRHSGGGIVLGCRRHGGDRAALVLVAPAGCTCCSPAALPVPVPCAAVPVAAAVGHGSCCTATR